MHGESRLADFLRFTFLQDSGPGRNLIWVRHEASAVSWGSGLSHQHTQALCADLGSLVDVTVNRWRYLSASDGGILVIDCQPETAMGLFYAYVKSVSNYPPVSQSDH